MKKGRPSKARVPAFITRLLDAVDQRVFRQMDDHSAARGWQVSRPRRFHRRYRDPRWDLVSVCAECGGQGTVAARSCAECGGDGRIIADPAAVESERVS